jgi:hypothetical protein
MEDYEFVRSYAMPQVPIEVFDNNLNIMTQHLTKPIPAMTFRWHRKTYATVYESKDDTYAIYLLAPCPRLKLWPPNLNEASLSEESLLGYLSADSMGIEVYPNADCPTYWGNWIDSAVFDHPIFEKEVTPAQVEYQDPSEDELDFLESMADAQPQLG